MPVIVHVGFFSYIVVLNNGASSSSNGKETISYSPLFGKTEVGAEYACRSMEVFGIRHVWKCV